MSSTLAQIFAGALRVLGLSLALFLGLMKWAALPCGAGGSCDSVLSSSYGSWFGIPVGFFAAVLWLISLLSRHDRLRIWSLGALTVGSLSFLALQAFVLRSFCPWCVAHALIAWASWHFRTQRVHWALSVVALILASGGHWIQRSIAKPPSALAKSSVFEQTRTVSLSWLGEPTPDSPVLVLSLRCASCWDRWLEPLARQNWKPRPGAPQIIWRMEPETRDLSIRFLAAVLSQSEHPAVALPQVLAFLDSKRSLLFDFPVKAESRLKERYPASEDFLGKAELIITSHAWILERAKLAQTPTLLQRNLPPVSRSSFEEDFAQTP